jgi:hypothetical protein
MPPVANLRPIKNSNMKRHVFYGMGILLMAFIVSSCKKEKDCDPEDEESPCYASVTGELLLTEQKTNGKASARYEYDDQNRRTHYHSFDEDGVQAGTITYTYNGDGNISVVTYKSGGGAISHRETFTYAQGDKPVSMVADNPSRDDEVMIDYQYVFSDKKLVETAIPRHDDGEVFVNTYAFDGEGNLLSARFTSGGQLIGLNEWSDFDDKPAAGINGSPFRWKNSVNNAQRFKVTSSVFNLDQVWRYTYNSGGHPVKAEVFNTGSDVLVEEHVFTYMPAK